MKSALVTGASGVLGPRLVRALLNDGWSVRTLTRNKPGPGLWSEGVDVRLGDVTIADQVAAAMDGVATVFHLAGLLHNPRPAAREVARYEAVNVVGARNVARAAGAMGVSVVAFSTIAVYGATEGPVDETTEARPVGLYAETKRRAEEALLETGQGACVLRLAAVYGRRMKGNYHTLVQALRRGLFVPIGSGSNRRTLVHEDDLMRAAILAAFRRPIGILNVTDGRTYTLNEIVEAICMALDRPKPAYTLPESAARLAARLIGRRDTVEKYLENVEVRGDLIQKTLGFVPAFDLLSGWRDAIRATEQHVRPGQEGR